MHLVSNTGIYCLIIRLPQGCSIKIGCLGVFRFPTGFYVYIGSAQNGLERRIERHVRRKKKSHWHIDYLLQHGQVVCVYTCAGKKDMECTLSGKIGGVVGSIAPAKGFGSSDCSCYSHLYFFQDDPDLQIVRLKIKMKLSKYKI